MKSILERRDRWGNGYSLWLIVGVTLLLPFLSWSLRQIEMDNDVTGWLPKGDPQARILDWYQSLFPSEERVLISWDDCSLTDPRLLALKERLSGRKVGESREGGSPYIADVTLPADVLQRMLKEKVPFDVAMCRMNGLLIGDGPLCLELTEAAASHSMIVGAAIQRMASEQFGLDVKITPRALPAPQDVGLTLEDENGWKLYEALKTYTAELQPGQLQLSWADMHLNRERTAEFVKALETFVVNAADSNPCIVRHWHNAGSMAAASVRLSAVGEDDPAAAVAVIREAAALSGIDASELHLGGRPIASTTVNAAVKHAAWNPVAPAWNLLERSPILLSVIVCMGLSWYMLGSLRLCLLVQGVSVLSAAMTVAMVPVTGGSMDMVLVVMPTLLMVITVSGAIHVCNYWRNSGIADPAKSVLHATNIAWLPCLLACATTGIGMASLMSGSLVPVHDFGLYAAIGTVISFICVAYLLPSLMLFWPVPTPRPAVREHARWNSLGRLLSRYATANCWLNLGLTAACMCGLLWFRTETKVIRYFPDDSRVVQDYNFLEENLSGIISVDTLVRFNTQQQNQVPFPERARKVLAVQAALQQHPEVSGSLSLASFMPPEDESAGKSVSERRNAKLRRNMMGDRIHEMLLKGGEESQAVSSLIALPVAAADWKKRGDRLLNHAGDEVWRITCQTSLMSDYDYEKLTAELNNIAACELKSFEAGRPAHVVTGLGPIFLRTQQALLESLINSFGLAFVLIAAVMIVLLRSVSAALWSMIPNVMPIAIVFGLLGWSGIRIDIGTMITASIALGIAVDGTLHLMTWFRNLLAAGVPRHKAVEQALEHCGPALWQTSAAIGFGMLTLIPVELLIVSRFGWIMSAMIFAALWGDVILLPSLLAGPLGAIMERVVARQQTPSSDSDHRDPPPVALKAEGESLRFTIDAPPVEIRAASTVPRAPHLRRLRAIFPRPAREV